MPMLGFTNLALKYISALSNESQSHNQTPRMLHGLLLLRLSFLVSSARLRRNRLVLGFSMDQTFVSEGGPLDVSYWFVGERATFCSIHWDTYSLIYPDYFLNELTRSLGDHFPDFLLCKNTHTFFNLLWFRYFQAQFAFFSTVGSHFFSNIGWRVFRTLVPIGKSKHWFWGGVHMSSFC